MNFCYPYFMGLSFVCAQVCACMCVCTKLKRCFFISSFINWGTHFFCINRIAVSASSKYNIKLSYRISKIYDTAHVHARLRKKLDRKETWRYWIAFRLKMNWNCIVCDLCSPFFSFTRCDKSIFRNKFKWNICTIISLGFCILARS